MLLFFGLVAIVGLLLIFLDFAAMSNDPTPSQYSMGVAGFGVMMLIVGGIGAACVYFT